MQADKSLVVLACQINPILGQIDKNILKVSKSLEKYSKDNQIDVVLFPEMAFTGYCFQNAKQIANFTTQCGKGSQFEICGQWAKRLNSYLAFGYAQKVIEDNNQVFYNSAAILNRQGAVIHNYRKSHLYFDDELWVYKEGEGFKTFEIQTISGAKTKCSLCICMDLNPYKFISNKYQYADFVVANQIQVVFFLTNWLDHEPEANQKPSISGILNYWVHRMRPTIGSPVLFFAADRVGTEYSYHDKKQVHFIGSSCGINLQEPRLLGNLTKKAESYLILQTYLPKK